MRAVFFNIVILLLFTGTAGAGPFLVCDPQVGAETYIVYSDGAAIASDVPAEADGSLKYDLSEIKPGVYEFALEACNRDWGCSELSNPYQSLAGVGKPTSLKLNP